MTPLEQKFQGGGGGGRVGYGYFLESLNLHLQSR